MKRLAIALVAWATPAFAEEWTIATPPGCEMRDHRADVAELARAMPGAIVERTTAAMCTAGEPPIVRLGVLGMVVQRDAVDAADQIAAIERANRNATSVREVRYEANEVAGKLVVAQQIDVGDTMMYRRRIYVAGTDGLIHYVDASCQLDAGACGRALASLELHVEPTVAGAGWLAARIAAGVVAIALAAWLAARFRRR